jgi:hypothetical protein
MIETGEVKKYYQWRTGFRSGRVECYLAETTDTIFFESGSSVPKSNLETDLIQINEEIYLQSSSSAQSQKALEDKWKEMMGAEIPPSNNIQIEEPKPAIVIKEKSPIQIILERQKKKESKSISINLEIKIPSSKVIELLTTMFDEDEVLDEIVSTSLDLSDEEIRKLIHESIIKVLKTNNVE